MKSNPSSPLLEPLPVHPLKRPQAPSLAIGKLTLKSAAARFGVPAFALRLESLADPGVEVSARFPDSSQNIESDLRSLPSESRLDRLVETKLFYGFILNIHGFGLKMIKK